MTEMDWGVLIGVLGLIVVVVGGVIARDRQLTNMIHTNHTENTEAIKQGDDELHHRINKNRDELSDKYVRRVDLDAYMSRLDKSISDVRTDLRDSRIETNNRLDAILVAVNGK